MTLRAAALAAVFACATAPAFAADTPCGKFNWPVDRELALLRAPRGETASGTTLPSGAPVAITLKLATGAALPVPSQKPADPAKFAGVVTLSVPGPGDYLVSLSGEAWIDVIEDGKPVASNSHSGDPNCPGLRKSVRFTLNGKPVTIEISNGPDDHIDVAVTPWYWGASAAPR